MKFYLTLEAPYHWVLVNSKAEVASSGSVDSLDQIKIPKTAQEVIGVASGDVITTQSVSIPGRRRNNVEAAIPYALEDSLTEDVEDLHFSLLSWSAGTAAEVAIVAKAHLIRWLSHTKDAGIRLDRIIPGYLLVPLHNAQSYSVAPANNLTNEDTVYVRSGLLNGFTLDRDFLTQWLSMDGAEGKSISITDMNLARELSDNKSVKVSHWDIGSGLKDWLSVRKQLTLPEDVSVLNGEFLPAHLQKNNKPIKTAMVVGICAAIAFFIGMVLEVNQLKTRNKQTDNEIRNLFKKSFPGEPYLGRPRSQVEGLLGQSTGDNVQNDFQKLLTPIAQVVQQYRGEIEEINFRDTAMTVLCNVNSLTVLDQIQEGLNKLPGLKSELLSSGAKNNRITGRFRVWRN